MAASPLVSVVITTKNEERNIENCLRSLKLQSYSNIEIIVVDNSSTDRTKEIARRYTENVFNKGPERSAQRNYGMIDKASGTYVMYIDADMLLSPLLIESCVEAMVRTKAVALHISETVLGTKYLSRVRRFERGFYDGTSIDGARFFDRETFVRVGGFDEPLFREGSGEDWDIDKLVRRHGSIERAPYSSNRTPETRWEFENFVRDRGVTYRANYVGIYHNESEIQLIPYLRKKLYYTKGFGGYIDKWGRDDPDIRRQFGLFYRYWTVFTEHGKWRKLVARPDLVIGMFLLRVLVGAVFVVGKRRAPRVVIT